MRREKKGVAGIIAGVMLAAILFTSVVIYFLAVTNGQTTRSKADLQAVQFRNEKGLESSGVKIVSHNVLVGNNFIQFAINNTGSLPVNATYLIVYNNMSIPVAQGPLTLVLNGGQSTTIDTSSVSSSFSADPNISKTYTIDLITDRGNVIGTTWPPPPPITIANCPSCLGNLPQALLAQNTGSVLLNYTGFGVIFPLQPVKDSVDQTGWNATVKGIKGYPAFRLPQNPASGSPTYVVTRVKNLDPSKEDMTLLADSVASILVLPIGGTGSNIKISGAYLCSMDETKPLSVSNPSWYNSAANPIILKNVVDPKNSPDAGWVNIYFCNSTTTNNHNPLDPSAYSASWDLSGLGTTPPTTGFFYTLIRGVFPDGRTYSQTVPYQSVELTTQTLPVTSNGNFVACSKSTSVALCSTGTDKYQATQSQIVSGVTVYVPVTFVNVIDTNTPFTVSWIYPDGTYKLLAKTSSNPVPVLIPNTMSDGTTPTKRGTYIIQVTDAKDNVFFMTFKVT